MDTRWISPEVIKIVKQIICELSDKANERRKNQQSQTVNHPENRRIPFIIAHERLVMSVKPTVIALIIAQQSDWKEVKSRKMTVDPITIVREPTSTMVRQPILQPNVFVQEPIVFEPTMVKEPIVLPTMVKEPSVFEPTMVKEPIVFEPTMVKEPIVLPTMVKEPSVCEPGPISIVVLEPNIPDPIPVMLKEPIHTMVQVMVKVPTMVQEPTSTSEERVMMHVIIPEQMDWIQLSSIMSKMKTDLSQTKTKMTCEPCLSVLKHIHSSLSLYGNINEYQIIDMSPNIRQRISALCSKIMIEVKNENINIVMFTVNLILLYVSTTFRIYTCNKFRTWFKERYEASKLLLRKSNKRRREMPVIRPC
jgi:hypothetical protein